MSLWNRMREWLVQPVSDGRSEDRPGFAINPASGLPMAGIVDTAGNPWGTSNFEHHHRPPDFPLPGSVEYEIRFGAPVPILPPSLPEPCQPYDYICSPTRFDGLP